jgi:hypothetical protein
MFFKLEIITHVLVLLYAVYFSFKHMMADNDKIIKKMFAFFVFISCIWLISRRDTYLPFLGYAVLPPSAIKDSVVIENANVEVKVPIDAKDGTRIIFWGAKPSNEVKPNPAAAYNDYSNLGITKVLNGEAVIRFNCPSRYKVGPGYRLDRHIHYRLVLDNGLMSPIQTKKVTC